MARRVTLPSADDLFRPTEGEAPEQAPDPQARRGSVRAVPAPPEVGQAEPEPERAVGASGRIRHDEKVTVYVTADELLAIERARLTLRGEHGLAVDRGRLVREAIHLALDGLEADAAASALVRRLAEQG